MALANDNNSGGSPASAIKASGSERSKLLRRCALGGSLILSLLCGSAYADDVRYAYDALGRVLEAANITSGQKVVYTYDAVGNITSTNVLPIGAVSISSISPVSGPAGTIVTVIGNGFSATSNTVEFNGSFAGASIASSDGGTKLVVTVPVGAASGPVTVRNSAGNAISGVSFAVTAGSGPSIASFPNAVNVNSDVTINGSGFDADPIRNKVLINGRALSIVSVSAGQIVVKAPDFVGVSPITIVTPLGQVSSSGVISVAPATVLASTVVSAISLPINYTVTAPQAQAGKTALFGYFDIDEEHKKGIRVVAQAPGAMSGSYVLAVYDPKGKLVASQTTSSNVAVFDLLPLTELGTYAVVASGPATSGFFRMKVTQAVHDEFRLDWGNMQDTTTVVSGVIDQVQILDFNGAIGQRIVMNYSSSDPATIALINPSGLRIWTAGLVAASGTSTISLPYLGETGDYQLIVDPGAGNDVSFGYVAGTDASFGEVGLGSMNGCCGQAARYQFSAQAGWPMMFRARSETGALRSVTLYYYSSPGTRVYLKPNGCCGTEGTNYEYMFLKLPVTGNYYLEWRASGSGPLIMTHQVTTGVQNYLSVNEPAKTVTMSAPYNNEFYILGFDASQGQALYLKTSIGSNGCGYRSAHVIDPSGNVVAVMPSILTDSTFLMMPNAPATGTYSIAILDSGHSYSLNMPYPAPNSYAVDSPLVPPTTSQTCAYTLTSP